MNLGKSLVSRMICAPVTLLLVACADFEVGSAVEYLEVSHSFEVMTCGDVVEAGPANGHCKVPISLTFPKGSDRGKTITLKVDRGTLASAQGSAVSTTEVAIRTASHRDGSTQVVAILIAPLEPGMAELTASAPDLLVGERIVFDRAKPSSLSLRATLRTFEVASARFTDLTVGISRAADAGLPSIGTEVLLKTCCPEIEVDGAPDCARFFSVPASVRSTSDEPTSLTVEGRLTAEGDNYLRQPVAEATSSSIFVAAGSATPPISACPSSENLDSWRADLIAAPTQDVVELRVARDAAQ